MAMPGPLYKSGVSMRSVIRLALAKDCGRYKTTLYG